MMRLPLLYYTRGLPKPTGLLITSLMPLFAQSPLKADGGWLWAIMTTQDLTGIMLITLSASVHLFSNPIGQPQASSPHGVKYEEADVQELNVSWLTQDAL